MHLCLFEDRAVSHLSPVTLTRGAYQIRTGGYTNLMRMWEAFSRPSLTLHARAALAALIRSQTGLPVNYWEDGVGTLFINGRITSISDAFVTQLKAVAKPSEPARVFLQDGVVIAAWVPNTAIIQFENYLELSSFDDFIECPFKNCFYA